MRDDRLMTVEELARFLHVPVATIYTWRYKRIGPVGYKVGRHVRYDRAAVMAWLNDQADDRS